MAGGIVGEGKEVLYLPCAATKSKPRHAMPLPCFSLHAIYKMSRGEGRRYYIGRDRE